MDSEQPTESLPLLYKIKGTVFNVQMIPFHVEVGLTRIAEARDKGHPLWLPTMPLCRYFTLVPKAKLNILPPYVVCKSAPTSGGFNINFHFVRLTSTWKLRTNFNLAASSFAFYFRNGLPSVDRLLY